MPVGDSTLSADTMVRDIPSAAARKPTSNLVVYGLLGLALGMIVWQWWPEDALSGDAKEEGVARSNGVQAFNPHAWLRENMPTEDTERVPVAERDTQPNTAQSQVLAVTPAQPIFRSPPSGMSPQQRALIEQAYAQPRTGANAGGSAPSARGNAYPDYMTQLAQNEAQLQQQMLSGMSQLGGGSSVDRRNHNTRFLEDVANSSVERVEATQQTNLPYMLLEGKFIHAVLDTAIDSTLPGKVKAHVTQDVYGAQGRVLLIPKGSQINGDYNSAVQRGQARVFTAWNRIRTPQGVDIPIGSAGADNLGRTGFSGQVDRHFWLRFRESALLSLLGAATANVGVSSTDQANSSTAYREAVATAFQLSSARALEQNMDIPDTIFKDQGERIIIFVARDVDFSRVYQQ